MILSWLPPWRIGADGGFGPRRSKTERLDGSYILKSDRDDLWADETWRFYVLLTRAENAFRSIKSPLLMRPLHHQRQERVETHIFLSVLAYHLPVAIEKTLLDQRVHTSWATVRETLRTHQVCTVVLPATDGSVLGIRRASTPEPRHVELYELPDVPWKIMAPRETRSDGEAPYSDGKNLQTLVLQHLKHMGKKIGLAGRT